MGPLLLKFSVLLSYDSATRSQGLLFHRWFPNGPDDAIRVAPHPKATLKFWFEPRECREGGISRGNAVPIEAIPTYGKIVGGSLRGSLEIQGRSQAEIQCIAENKQGDPTYVQLGKLIIQDLLYEPLSRFTRILRINYGQYWINELPVWDSRSYTLGAYCSSILNLQCSTDDGNTWIPFQPTELMVTFNAGVIGGRGRAILRFRLASWLTNLLH